MTEPRNKLLFIMGHARSGSTILNILLGNIPGVVAAGELGNFYQSGVHNDEYCSCGKPVSDCEFWGPIASRTRERLDGKVEKFAFDARQLENWRNLLFPGRMARLSLDSEHYLSINKALLDDICHSTNKHTLVDASKDPMRFHYLRKLDKDYEFRVLHIVRDPRAVCHSMQQSFARNPEKGLQRDMPGKSVFLTVKSLYIADYLANRLRGESGTEFMTIRYDDLTQSPSATLDAIGTFIGMDTSALIARLKVNGSLEQFHNVAGNRLRMQQDITLRHDEGWRKTMPFHTLLLSTILTLPMLLKYRFRIF